MGQKFDSPRLLFSKISRRDSRRKRGTTGGTRYWPEPGRWRCLLSAGKVASNGYSPVLSVSLPDCSIPFCSPFLPASSEHFFPALHECLGFDRKTNAAIGVSAISRCD